MSDGSAQEIAPELPVSSGVTDVATAAAAPVPSASEASAGESGLGSEEFQRGWGIFYLRVAVGLGVDSGQLGRRALKSRQPFAIGAAGTTGVREHGARRRVSTPPPGRPTRAGPSP